MSGTGIVFNYYVKYLTWSLRYSKALDSSDYLQIRDGMKKEENSWY